MGILFHDLSKTFKSVADLVYYKHFEDDPRLEQEYNDYRKQKMYEDIMHNLSFLEVSYRLNNQVLFESYAKWLHTLMHYLMPDIKKERLIEQMVTHYTLLKDALKQTVDDELFSFVGPTLDLAITVSKNFEIIDEQDDFSKGAFGAIRERYLNYLLDGKQREAIQYIKTIKKEMNLTVENVYIDILQVVMNQVGKLWHQNKVSVDQEHYITSVTQMVLSQFYDEIFSSEKKDLKLLSCSVGSELHEMGARMVSDLFEYHGWDTTYLGAAIPKKALLLAIKQHQPDLIALSVTMPQHLLLCKDFVESIKAEFPNLKIAVGGRAFMMSQQDLKDWAVDVYKENVIDLIGWTEGKF